MKDLIDITDKSGRTRKVELVTTFTLPEYNEYTYIVYRELDASHNYLAKYKGEDIVNLDTNISELEFQLAKIIFQGVKQ